MPARPRLALLALPLLVGGCLSPNAAQPVAQSTLAHARALEAAHTQDLAALRAAAETLLRIRRERLLTELQLEFVARWTTPDGRPDAIALDAALADPDDGSALVADLRAGRLSRDNAARLLADFAASEALSNAPEARRALLANLSPVAQHDADALAVLAALDERAAQIARLHAELQADAGAVAQFTGAEPALDAASRAAALELWNLAAAATLHNPTQREAAQRLLEQLLRL